MYTGVNPNQLGLSASPTMRSIPLVHINMESSLQLQNTLYIYIYTYSFRRVVKALNTFGSRLLLVKLHAESSLQKQRETML